ncbi:helicase-exonuclease AddAB subunit AddA [Aneurinibacillus uraniidurans]|uniref:helicase-exonuclease AddAB subunit AddA n=1 Tax=Aneurinibacillus uraniidurans TaxID=2966586 RepID=UPI002349CE1C|nr:helicase-exonuclease AddAB subunit AddA [Aneurinibacillus sp. B1]WCN36376.1 helicase-exonuclease AddAB subunit AddA [Aneurinibacillus sp. B1]
MEMEKPVGSTWTDEQWSAIAARGSHILVAAAAGSGKTAVLVERIIRRIADESDPINVDNLLVVTFTKAAAAEMRQRIGEKLEEAVREQSSLYLRRQLALLPRASIMTLHSFCMEVLQRYYYFIDLDPSFRIADETEAQLLRQEALDGLFDEQYVAEDTWFFRLVDSYATDRGDEALQALVQRLYDFARSHPDPDQWLHDMAAMYEARTPEEFYEQKWFQALTRDVQLELAGIEALLTRAVDLAQENGGPAPYLANLTPELTMVQGLIAASERSWAELADEFAAAVFGRLKACRGDQYDATLVQKAKDVRELAKKRLEKLRGELFAMTLEEQFVTNQELSPLIGKLVDIVQTFGMRYAALKKEKGLVDFSDLEHYCLQILRAPDSKPGELAPSAAALDYRAQFGEVLVDEYQDTNGVQETIVRLVSRSGDGEAGNLFMVGDPKQSIYRFRLAEPDLFLSKYKSFQPDGTGGGRRIDLAKNFRSRQEVLDGANFVFHQIMSEDAAEIDYDTKAALVFGFENYPEMDGLDTSVEVMLIDRHEADAEEASWTDDDESDVEETASDVLDTAELENVQLETRLIAEKIKSMIAAGHQVYDKQTKAMRAMQYRDVVVLLRATSQWAPVMTDEFKALGIPAYAELATGYFTATEIEVMTSLLHVIDNPYQDIPLAGVLRSPLVQLTAEELANIRLADKNGAYYDALLAYVQMEEADPVLRTRLTSFLQKLETWRTKARQGALSTLIWDVFRDTGFYDFAGGLPGGKQRQANLRALYDRACQYEATSFRGLFRFLRFMERMQDQGGDLGTARSLGEQEDVVRIMTIHKSKGLEFPVVFVAGLSKQHNFMDLNRAFLLHKDLGFGPKYIDPDRRISFPSLPYAALRRRMRMEQLAEEMRVLYVALTRAKEKLILVGTAKNLQASIEKWTQLMDTPHWNLPAYELVAGKTYLDWIGPALMRHDAADGLRDAIDCAERPPADIAAHRSRWTITCRTASSLLAGTSAEQEERTELARAVQNGERVSVSGGHAADVVARLTWKYDHEAATVFLPKQSVSELKRRKQAALEQQEAGWQAPAWMPGLFKSDVAPRPQFLTRKELNAAERGTVMHTVLQQLPHGIEPDEGLIREFIDRLVGRELLTETEANGIDVGLIVSFLTSPIGQKLRTHEPARVYREQVFTLSIPAREAYGEEWPAAEEESVLVQGVIDCLIDEGDGWIVLDYKTDRTEGLTDELLLARYQEQLTYYARAVEQITGGSVKEKVLYFLDGGRTLYVP